MLKKLAMFAGKKAFEIVKPKIAKNLTTKRNIQDKVVKAVDEGTKKGLAGAKPSQDIKQSASKMKRDESKKLKGVSYEYDRLAKKFAKTKANIEKKKKIAGATAVGSGTAAAGLMGKKIKDERVKKMGGGMMGRRFGMRSGTPFKKETDVDKIKKTFAPKKNLKKIPEGKKGEGLRKLKAARPDVTRKMGFLKRGGRA